MKRFHTILFLTLALMPILSACSDEDTPEVDFIDPSSRFKPADDDNSATAQLRRNFFSNNGVYLLFNDTLQHVYQGTDINNQPVYFTELLDMGYTVGATSTSSTTYTYTYLEGDSLQRAAVEFLEADILSHFTQKMKPYSFLLANTITGTNTNMGTTLRPYAVSNQRAVAVAYNYLTRPRTDAQRQRYAQQVINAMIGQMANNNADAFADFFAFSSAYYSVNYNDLNLTNVGRTEMLNYGFISSAPVSQFPSQSVDLNAYTMEAIQYTDEQLNQRYAGYTIVLQKFAVVKSVLSQLGYIF